METFYATQASIAFTLLGMWWVVLQLKYDLWMSTPARRLTAYAASMHFIAPGLIALVAVLSTDESQIWRLGAAIGGALGAAVGMYAVSAAALTLWQRVQEAILVSLFLAIILLSFSTIRLFGLSPIALEALVNVGVLGLGVHFVWQFFTESNT